MRQPKPLAAAGLILMIALSARAQSFEDFNGIDGDWTPYVPPPPGQTSPANPEGGFSAPDRIKFDENLRSKVLDQICRNVKLTKDYRPDLGSFSGTGLGFSRRLMPEPGGRLALVDEERLNVSWGESLSRPLSEGGPAMGISIGARIDGRSMVVRRLENKQTCKEIDTLIDLRDIKTVIPVNSRRISEMAVGELWRLPFSLTVGYGANLSDALGENAPASISFGYSKSGAASMTLYRISPELLRFRFRADYVTVRSRGVAASYTVGAGDFLMGWENVLLRLIDKAVAKEFVKILSARLGFSMARSDGQRMLLEYTIDPRDPAQAQALAEAVKGDFDRLLKSAARIVSGHITADDAGPAYREFREISNAKLGDPGHGSAEVYTVKSRSLTAGLPVVFWTQVSESFGSSTVTEFTGPEGEFRFHPADHSPSFEFLRIPFMGPMVKDNHQRRAEVVTHARKGEGQGEPLLVYIENQGALRLTGSTMADRIEQMNSLLRLTGARRGQGGTRLELPRSVYPVGTPVPSPEREGDSPYPREVSDRKGAVSLTMVYNQKAVREAVSAASGEVLKAFAATVGIDDRAMMSWLAENGRIENGRLAYDEKAAAQAFTYDGAYGDLYRMSRLAAELVADLADARDADSNDHKAEALAKAMAGKGRSGLAYEQVLKVLVQFMDPMDVTGDFSANIVNMTDKAGSLAAHLVLKEGRSEVPMLQEAGTAKGRFAEPSILFD